MGRRALSVLVVLAASAAGAGAQIIPIRTIPLAQGDQYLLFPSANLGRGGVSIALADSLLDPFRNPALGARTGAFGFFSAPTIYSISRQAGGGRTLPLGLLGRSGSWFGAVSAAIQEVQASRPMSSGVIFTPATPLRAQDISGGATDPSHGNVYAFASIGRAFPSRTLALGGSVAWHHLSALDGLDLLYPTSVGITQSGHEVDLRVGLSKQWAGNHSLDALLLYDRFHLRHDVSFLDLFWDPGTQQFVQSSRVEHNVDRTVTTGMHLAYQRPLGDAGWRIGWIGTVNFVSSPRISQNEVVTIPRDQGHSAAYNVGVGVSKTRDRATFGLDAVYEPIWSTTWSAADAPLVAANGDTIPVGGRTIENRFRFSNVVLRLGVSRDVPLAGLRKAVGLELGLAVRALRYRLEQHDRLAGIVQPFRTSWVEWSPTWGLSLRFPELELRYRGRVLNGGGRPTQSFGGPWPLAAIGPGGFLLAPGGNLSLAGVATITHQVSLSLPLR